MSRIIVLSMRWSVIISSILKIINSAAWNCILWCKHSWNYNSKYSDAWNYNFRSSKDLFAHIKDTISFLSNFRGWGFTLLRHLTMPLIKMLKSKGLHGHLSIIKNRPVCLEEKSFSHTVHVTFIFLVRMEHPLPRLFIDKRGVKGWGGGLGSYSNLTCI